MNTIKTVGVIGAGTMGQGIAQVFASGGLKVLLFDSSSDMPDKAIERISYGLKSLVDRGKITEMKKSDILSSIHPIQKQNEIVADLIIEAVVEDLGIKQNLFAVLEKVNSPDSIFCTNTSSLSVTQIFSACQFQKRCLGVHFFNPAPIMKLVELVSTEATDINVLNNVADLLKKLGKTTVLSKDSPGFIVNRVARHFYLESMRVLEDDIASYDQIDELLRAAGFKMGPFELMDLIGVDVNLAVSTAVFNGFNQNPKYKPSEIQVEKVKQGLHGRKTGKGFYDYSKK